MKTRRVPEGHQHNYHVTSVVDVAYTWTKASYREFNITVQIGLDLE